MARVRQGLIAVTRSLRSPQWGPLHYHIHYLLAIDDKDDTSSIRGNFGANGGEAVSFLTSMILGSTSSGALSFDSIRKGMSDRQSEMEMFTYISINAIKCLISLSRNSLLFILAFFAGFQRVCSIRMGIKRGNVNWGIKFCKTDNNLSVSCETVQYREPITDFYRKLNLFL